jgi:hypothetical protein
MVSGGGMDAGTRAHLESVSPGMAARWMRLAGSPSRHVANPERVVDLPKVRVGELPRGQSRLKGAFVRDYGRLRPDGVVRHVPRASRRANEFDPTREGPVDFEPGAFPHKMGVPGVVRGAVGRDLVRSEKQLRGSRQT